MGVYDFRGLQIIYIILPDPEVVRIPFSYFQFCQMMIYGAVNMRIAIRINNFLSNSPDFGKPYAALLRLYFYEKK